MRRLILDEPYSIAAVWSRKLAVFAAVVAGLSLALARSQSVDATAALAVFGGAVLTASAAALFALTGAVVIWRTGRRGVGLLITGIVVAGLVLAMPAWLSFQAVRLPMLNDVSTDLVDPPEFARSAQALAARGSIEHAALSDDQRETERRAYPDLQPIVLDLEADEAWRLVLKAVAARGWRVIDQIKPGGRTGAGHIDAIDRSAVMGFPDDVTIRVRPLAGQTRIDVRSASRFGRHDFGANARRIAKFATELQAQLDAK